MSPKPYLPSFGGCTLLSALVHQQGLRSYEDITVASVPLARSFARLTNSYIIHQPLPTDHTDPDFHRYRHRMKGTSDKKTGKVVAKAEKKV